MTIRQNSPVAVVGQYLLYVIDFMKLRNISAEALLANTGLNEIELRQYPEQAIALKSFITLLHNLHTLDPSPTLSLEFGLSLQLSNHGFLGYALQASPTLGDALKLAHNFSQTRSQIIAFSFQEIGSTACIRIDDSGLLGEQYKYIVETLIACFFNIGRKLLGHLQLDQVQVDLAIDEQEHHQVLQIMVKDNLRFHCEHTQISFPATWLATQLPQSDPHLAELAAARCREELKQSELNSCLQGEFINKVMQELKQQLANSKAQENVSNALHITPRTLHRRLAQHGLQFKQLIDELRHQAALEQLRNRNGNIAEIALALGYSDQANFVRAFKRWTGKTPTQYQRNC